MGILAPKGCAFQAQPVKFLCGCRYSMSETLLHRWSTSSALLWVEGRLARVFGPAWVASTSERQVEALVVCSGTSDTLPYGIG